MEFDKTERPWGYYEVILTEGHQTKLKQLVCMPGESLSMQRHQHRSELWYVSSGKATVELEDITVNLNQHDYIQIDRMEWHRLYNPYDEPCKIIEIQYGDFCEEDDIERR